MIFENPWASFIYKPFPGKVLNSIHVILEYKIPVMVLMRMKIIMGIWNPIQGIYLEPFMEKQPNPFLLYWNVKSH